MIGGAAIFLSPHQQKHLSACKGRAGLGAGERQRLPDTALLISVIPQLLGVKLDFSGIKNIFVNGMVQGLENKSKQPIHKLPS